VSSARDNQEPEATALSPRADGAAASALSNGRLLTASAGSGYIAVLDMLKRRFPRLLDMLKRVFEWQRIHSPALLRVELASLRVVGAAYRKVRSFAVAVGSRTTYRRVIQLKVERNELRRKIDRLSQRTSRLDAELQRYAVHRPVITYLDFAQSSSNLRSALEAEVYVGHGVQSLPAAAALARETGGRYFCDCIEIPSFFDRAVPVRWSEIDTDFLDSAFASYLRRADGVMTVGWALAEELQEYSNTVTVIPNYRHRQTLQPSTELRDRCGLGPGDKLVLSLSTVASGFEPVLEALALLPADVHLAAVGKFVPAEYEHSCEALARELGVSDRFHRFAPIEYAQLTSFVSGADVGLIVRDPQIRNNAISLPNRIFDYMFSSVPVCSPEIPDIARIIRDEDMGAVIGDMTPAAWAAGIDAVLAQRDAMRANALSASGRYIWENLEDELFEVLGRPRSVCYVGANQLHQNNRTRRMAQSLMARGAEVKIAYLHRVRGERSADSYREDGITFVPVVC